VSRATAIAALLCLTAAACEAPATSPPGGLGPDTSEDAAAGPDTGPETDAGGGSTANLPWAGMAVVCSDYGSTSVALVDAAGRTVTTPTLIHSGSLPPGVLPALGGDVDLPTTAPPDGSVLLLDRTPSAVLTFVDPATGAVRRQVSVATGFAANPHDALVVGGAGASGGTGGGQEGHGLPPGSVLVTRYDPNPTAEAAPRAADAPAPLNAGDDLLLVGPEGAAVAALPFTEPDGFPGRPDRLVPVGPSTVWVSLNRVSRDWQRYREGAVAVVDVAGVRGTGEAAPTLTRRETLPVADLTNCGALAVAPPRGEDVRSGSETGAEAGWPTTRAVALACGGTWQVGTSSFDPDESALVLWDVTPDGSGVERARLLASALPGAQAARTFGPGLAVLPSGAVVATAYGSDGGGRAGRAAAGDVAVLWQPDTGQVQTLWEASAPWTLWAAQATLDGAVLLPVADDLDPELCRLEVGGGAPAVSCVDACASTGLPPRAVRPFLHATR